VNPNLQAPRILESIVLALMILDPMCARIALTQLRDDDFQCFGHIVARFRPMSEAGTLDHVTAGQVLSQIYQRDFVTEEIMRFHNQQNASASQIETYCGMIAQESQRRNGIKLAQEALHALSDPNAIPSAILEKTRLQSEEIAARGRSGFRGATFSAVVAQIEQEIRGEREDYGWPGCPIMAESSALTPGSLNVICAKPGDGKSLFVFDLIRKLHGVGVPSAVMNLEKEGPWHMRRIMAQYSEVAGVTKARWTRANVQQWEEIRARVEAEMLSIENAMVLQTPLDHENPTKDFLIQWVKSEIQRGTKVIVIDPITAMYEGRNARYIDEKAFVFELKKLIQISQTTGIIVTHPKNDSKNIFVKPEARQMAGSQAFEQFTDCIFWLLSHKAAKTELMEGRFGLPGVEAEYDKELWWLKIRNDGGSQRRVAFRFRHGSLTYSEIGILPDSVLEPGKKK
jgi:replicative DNA helicase